ncbi:MAG: hypothetical protein C0467_22325 [Planctomycetaceae bacterium]|nr:hypothetical protein [Planctomycetaceae bacterium]
MHNLITGAIFLTASLLFVELCHGADDAPKKLDDAEITKHLVGKWAVDEVGDHGLKVRGTAHFKKDGTFEAEATIGDGEKPVKLSLSGTWKVSDGVIVSTVTKSSSPAIVAQGRVTKNHVISIGERTIKHKSEMGKECIRTRIKE